MLTYKFETNLKNLDINLEHLTDEVYDYCKRRYNFKNVTKLLKLISDDMSVFIKDDIMTVIEIKAPIINNEISLYISARDDKTLTNHIFPLDVNISAESLEVFNIQEILKKVYCLVNSESKLDMSLPIVKMFNLLDDSLVFNGKLKDIPYKTKLFDSKVSKTKYKGFSIEFTNYYFKIESNLNEYKFLIELEMINNVLALDFQDVRLRIPADKFYSLSKEEFSELLHNSLKYTNYQFNTIEDFSEALSIKSIINY